MNRRIVILICVYIGIIILFAYLRPEKADWTPSFSPQRSIPFAAQVLFRELSSVRTELRRVADKPIYNTLSTLPDDQSSIYFFLNNRFEPSSLDIEKLLEYAARGGTVFISTNSMADELLDTLGIRPQYEFVGVRNNVEWFYEDNVSLSLTSYSDSTWPASVASGYWWYESNDSTHVVIGSFDNTHPNFIACAFGDGMFYLHTFPYMFSNYHMLYGNNHGYVSRAFAEIPEADVLLWDAYYLSSLGGRAQTPLAALNRYQSFRWAYWLGIAGIGFFLFFTAKRRQRVIPILKPKRNTTLDFVRTIGDLYFHRADHADLIRKKITILQAQIQKQYRITVNEFSADEAADVAVCSGLDRASIESLFKLVRSLRDNESPHHQTLFALQKSIDGFLKRLS